jgi:predicted metal-dependent phosphoesterase TrpH
MQSTTYWRGNLESELKADLHIHTTASDGVLSPAELVEESAGLGLAAVGICDHDTVDGIDEALEAGKRFGVEIVPGVEINTDVGIREVHILGYFFDHRSEKFLEHMQKLRDARYLRGRKMVEKLQAAGVPVTLERVREIAGDAPIGRPHVAQAIVETGLVGSINCAFGKYLVRNMPGYVERVKMTPEEAIGIIISAGGVAGIAHPSKIGNDDLIAGLVKAGARAIEVFHSDHSPDVARYYGRVAKKFDLIPTAGSDFHRFDSERTTYPGCVSTDYSIVERLREESEFSRR